MVGWLSFLGFATPLVSGKGNHPPSNFNAQKNAAGLYLLPFVAETIATYGQLALLGLSAIGFLADATESWVRNTEPVPTDQFQRGVFLEQKTGANLGGNFQVIDDFRDGTGTSIKTHGLSSVAQLRYAIRQDLNPLQGIENRELRGVVSQANGGMLQIIREGEIETKALLVGIPETQASWLRDPTLQSTLRTLSQQFRTVIRVIPVKGWRI